MWVAKRLWPTLVHVHVATEVLETLPPWATGLYFIVKVWLVTSTKCSYACFVCRKEISPEPDLPDCLLWLCNVCILTP